MLLIALAMAAPVDPWTEPDEAELYLAEQRLVTVASRYAQTAREAPAIVTVVSAREIRQRGYRTLSDLLRDLPGVYVSMSPESRSLAWFRGVISPDNNKFLLLVDGVPWYDGVYTHAWIDEYIPLSMVKQVEVIKGPGSAIYGTNAFAGVVNVVTYGPGELPESGFIRASGGSGARVEATALAGGGSAVAWARVLDQEGVGLDTTTRDRRNVQGQDPTRSVNAGLRLQQGGWSLAVDHVDYRHTYFALEQDDPLDLLFQEDQTFNFRYRNEFVSARYTFQPSRSLRLAPYVIFQDHDNPGVYAYGVGVAVDEDGNASLTGTLVETEKHTQRWAGGLEMDLQATGRHHTVAGLGMETVHVLGLYDEIFEDFSHDPVSPRTFRAPEAWVSDAFAYGQHTWTALYWLELTAGVRADYNFTADYFFPSPRAGVLVVPSDTLSAKLLYGRAFRAPNARELLVEVALDENGEPLFTAGNPALVPETIQTVEFELTSQPLRPLTLRGAGYASLLGNTIDKEDGLYINRGGGTILGAEAEVDLELERWDASASYAFTHARDEVTGFRVYEFPPHMAKGRVTWTAAEGLWLTGTVEGWGARPREEWSPDAGLPDGDPFVLAHAGLATDAFDGRARLDLSVRNLMNTDYSTLIYVDDANALSDDAAKYPNDLAGEGRTINAAVEIVF